MFMFHKKMYFCDFKISQKYDVCFVLFDIISVVNFAFGTVVCFAFPFLFDNVFRHPLS